MTGKQKDYYWASGDRYTASSTVWERTSNSGVERVTVEEVRVLRPKSQQIFVGPFGPRVVSRSTTLYNKATGKAVKPRTTYWTVSQCGFGGRGTKHDPLGGFWTGQFETYYDQKTVSASVNDLLDAGFARK